MLFFPLKFTEKLGMFFFQSIFYFYESVRPGAGSQWIYAIKKKTLVDDSNIFLFKFTIACEFHILPLPHVIFCLYLE